MIIQNEKANLIVIPLKKMKCLIKYKKDQINLVPGCNEIPEYVWEEVKQRFPMINEMVKKKEINEIATKKVKKEKTVIKTVKEKTKAGEEIVVEKAVKEKYDGIESKNFDELTNEMQRELVDETWTIDTLELWRKMEIDTDIRVLIDDQIKAIRERKTDPNIGKREKNKK